MTIEIPAETIKNLLGWEEGDLLSIIGKKIRGRGLASKGSKYPPTDDLADLWRPLKERHCSDAVQHKDDIFKANIQALSDAFAESVAAKLGLEPVLPKLPEHARMALYLKYIDPIEQPPHRILPKAPVRPPVDKENADSGESHEDFTEGNNSGIDAKIEPQGSVKQKHGLGQQREDIIEVIQDGDFDSVTLRKIRDIAADRLARESGDASLHLTTSRNSSEHGDSAELEVATRARERETAVELDKGLDEKCTVKQRAAVRRIFVTDTIPTIEEFSEIVADLAGIYINDNSRKSELVERLKFLAPLVGVNFTLDGSPVKSMSTSYDGRGTGYYDIRPVKGKPSRGAVFPALGIVLAGKKPSPPKPRVR